MKKEKENVYKKIYDAYCKWIKETEYKNSFLFFDNDGSICLEAWEEIELKHLGAVPERKYGSNSPKGENGKES